MTRGILAVHVVEGRDLKKTDEFGFGDPYVEIWLDKSNQKFKTETRRDTNTPVWDRKYHYNVTNQCELHVRVMDEDVLTDDAIGTATVDISEIYRDYYKDMWIDLPDVDGKHRDGQIHLVLEYFPN
ncbi:calcineurin temperature suppressor cts1 [Gigaspora margarita]|uniref:Calcineurin temperature suppressor cts1 n=1 Tax=Gigaspora margarita TaxID=4874 RepID=A0A8H3X7L3_GIGMA|nr:calcineurin temperature suppressor cts1 [Gigaspora margarita]